MEINSPLILFFPVRLSRFFFYLGHYCHTQRFIKFCCCFLCSHVYFVPQFCTFRCGFLRFPDNRVSQMTRSPSTIQFPHTHRFRSCLTMRRKSGGVSPCLKTRVFDDENARLPRELVNKQKPTVH